MTRERRPAIARTLRLTRLGLAAERAARAFWPLASVLFAGAALWLSGVLPLLDARLAQGLVAALSLGAVATAITGARRFRWPAEAEARARLDATLPGQPLATLDDEQAIGTADPASRAVWQAHRARMAERLAGARAPLPRPDLPRRDPFALRLLAITALVVALIFGARTAPDALTALLPGAGPAPLADASWEGWIEPPTYTGKPTLYLADQPPGALAVPTGSRVTLRLYGKPGAVEVTSPWQGSAGAPEQVTRAFTIDSDGTLAIGRDSWQVTAMPDSPPEVRPDGELTRDVAGEMRLPFAARDDYGVVAGQATIALDLSRLDRRYGLAAEPEPRAPIVVDLPMPFRGGRDAFSEVLVGDFSQHPWAGMPVTLTLAVTDAAGQAGDSAPVEITLPGRRFLNPLAGGIAEMRRDILWTLANAPRAARILRALSNRPDTAGFPDPTLYLKLRTAVRQLEAGVDAAGRDEVASVLWDIAVEIEDGALSDALEALRRAQERLSEAMRQGASPEELAQLMDEYRQALNDYMRQLADNAEPGEDQQAQGDTMEMSMADLQAMMDRIEELMQQGRTAEAEQALRQLQQMMENMQVARGGQGQGQQGEGQQAMEDLRDTLRQQQELSDEAFRNLQRQQGQQGQGQQGQGQQPGQKGEQPGPGQVPFGQGQDGQQGRSENRQGQDQGQAQDQGQGQGQGTGEDGTGTGDLAGRQRALEDELARQRGGLPGAGSEEGDAAREALGRAGRAMDDAAGALDRGDTSGALDSQAEAMEALRDGMRSLDEAMRRQAQDRGQQGTGGEQRQGRAGDRPSDPLGRNPSGSGATSSESPLGNTEDVYRRAQELMDLLRQRAGEQDRPDIERDYIQRLLDLF